MVNTRRSNSRFDGVKNSQISHTDGHTQTDTQSDFLGFLSKPKNKDKQTAWWSVRSEGVAPGVSVETGKR